MKKVSIITSLFNEAKNLPLLFSSIQNQTFKDFEFLITDDGSTDETAKKIKEGILNGINLRSFSQPNKGLTYSLNHMVDESSGQYIARMDAGDFSYPKRIEKQVEYFDNHPEVLALGCWVKVKYDQWPLFEINPPNDHKRLKKMLEKKINIFTHGSIMFRKNVLEHFSPLYRFPYAQDFDFLLRLSGIGKLAIIEEILYDYYVSMNSVSYRKQPFQNKFCDLALQYNKTNNNFISKERIENDIKNIMSNTQEINEKEARSIFFKFIGNLFLRNSFLRKAKKYFNMSFENGRKKSKLLIYLCNFGKIATLTTNLIGKYFNPSWKYQINRIPAEFECEKKFKGNKL